MKHPLWKTVLFRIHWIIGVVAGIVLVVQGATGALLAVRGPVLDALAIEIERGDELTDPAQWIARAEATKPGWIAQGVVWRGPTRGVDVRFAPPGGMGHAENVTVDPWRGVVMDRAQSAEFFAFIERLHRELLAGETGKRITGITVIGLLIMLVTGLVLRWPRRSSVRVWLKPSLHARGRARWWSLHSVLATWVLPVFLVITLTGVLLSYPTLRAAVGATLGVPAQQRPPPGTPPPPPPIQVDLRPAFAALLASAPHATMASLQFPRAPDAPLEWRILDAGAPHERAFDKLRVGADGSVLAHDRFAALPAGPRLMQEIIPIHTGTWFGLAGQVAMFVAGALLPFFAVTGIWMWVLRRRARRMHVPLPATVATEAA